VVAIEAEDGEEEEDMEADVEDVEVSVETTIEVVQTTPLWVPEDIEVFPLSFVLHNSLLFIFFLSLVRAVHFDILLS